MYNENIIFKDTYLYETKFRVKLFTKYIILIILHFVI